MLSLSYFGTPPFLLSNHSQSFFVIMCLTQEVSDVLTLNRLYLILCLMDHSRLLILQSLEERLLLLLVFCNLNIEVTRTSILNIDSVLLITGSSLMSHFDTKFLFL